MASFKFKIEEVNRNGYIAWDAIDVATGKRFPVNVSEPYVAGTFPEITEYLKTQGVAFRVAYLNSSIDSLSGTTWTYVRGDDKVVIHDIPRTIFRITAGS